MNHKNVTISFHWKKDKDLIEWMEGIPHREISKTVRRILRSYMQAGGVADPIGLLIGMVEVVLFKLDGLEPGAGTVHSVGELGDDLPQDIKENLGGLGR